jgi:pyruvate-formate lyase
MPTKKQTASQRKAAQAAVDHEEAVVAERERRRAARERRADKVRAIEDAVAAEHRRQEITLFRSSLELEVKEGARSLGNDLRWFLFFSLC